LPNLEYLCTKCGHRFERLQKFSDPYVSKCPKCRGKVELVLSAPAVQFKGGGWYVTDYAKKSSAPAGESKSGESKSEGKSTDSKSSETSKESKESKEKEKDTGKKAEKKK
jgi:putative FmdB family regulatory protein